MPFTPGQVQALTGQEYEWARAASEVYFGEDVVDVPYAATLVLPAPTRQHTVYNVALLTAGTIVPAIQGLRKGMRVTFLFAAGGVFTVTWNAQQKAATNGAAANGQFASTTFVFNGTQLVQDGGALAYK